MGESTLAASSLIVEPNGSAPKKEFEFVLSEDITWGDYKKISGDATPFGERVALIEAYVRVKSGDMDDAPLGAVLKALRKLVEDAGNPNA